MEALDTYNKLFTEILGVAEDQLGEGLAYQSVDNWDSVGHMQLMSAIEDAFDVMLDTDDIIDFNSYDTGKKILAKYDVEF